MYCGPMLDLPIDLPLHRLDLPAVDLPIHLFWTYAEHTYGFTLDLPQTCLPVDLHWIYDGPSSIDLSMELLVLDLNPFST